MQRIVCQFAILLMLFCSVDWYSCNAQRCIVGCPIRLERFTSPQLPFAAPLVPAAARPTQHRSSRRLASRIGCTTVFSALSQPCHSILQRSGIGGIFLRSCLVEQLNNARHFFRTSSSSSRARASCTKFGPRAARSATRVCKNDVETGLNTVRERGDITIYKTCASGKPGLDCLCASHLIMSAPSVARVADAAMVQCVAKA